jgi:hypothetical protein
LRCSIPKSPSPNFTKVDGFWSIGVYNAKGYFEKNQYDAYSLNNITAKKSEDGSVAIQFGGCDGRFRTVCLLLRVGTTGCGSTRPRTEILSGKWKIPEPQPVL